MYKYITGAAFALGFFITPTLTLAQATSFVDFQVNNCTIPAGQSTCRASIFVGSATQYNQGKIYSVQNLTRGITSGNLILPSLYSPTLGKYFLDGSKPSILGDSAEFLTYGLNNLNLLDGSNSATANVVMRGSATASCATGTTWSGSICATNPTSYPTTPAPSGGITLAVPNCTIPAGASVCTSKPTSITGYTSGTNYDLYSESTYVTTSNAFNALNGYSFNPFYGGTAAELRYGSNTLEIRSSGSSTVLAKAVATATCALGTVWTQGFCVGNMTLNPPSPGTPQTPSSPISSLTSAQIQSVLSLLSSFGVDATTIANVTAALTGGRIASSSGQPFCYNFNSDLTVGSNGTPVTALNQALAASGIDTTGNGSLFTENVAANVVSFQAKYGIRQTGYVGPLTRAKLNALYGCGSGQQSTGTVNNPYANPNDPNYYYYQYLRGTGEFGAGSVAPSSTAPVISSISPALGAVGTMVTLSGSGFTATGNKIKFGNLGIESNPAYNLNSADGKTLSFTIPSSNYVPCWNTFPRCMTTLGVMIASGTYPVSVINANGTSNSVTFTLSGAL
ncbi:peptidoglycan-binding protein [Patescibacteria group bacterium]|nr:peptidoglycan-binding protein [Patescibacteria group bacterium]